MDTSARNISNSVVEERIPERSLRDLYYILFRHKGKAILFFLAAVVSVTVVTLLSPKIYRSEAKLLVRLGSESVTQDPTATTGQTVNVSQARASEIKSELAILQSQDLAEKLVDSIGWSEAHRIICKVEVSDEGENIRFVVTNLETKRTQWIYETIYVVVVKWRTISKVTSFFTFR